MCCFKNFTCWKVGGKAGNIFLKTKEEKKCLRSDLFRKIKTTKLSKLYPQQKLFLEFAFFFN